MSRIAGIGAVATVLAVLVVAAGLGGSARAYFSAKGSGTAAATVSKLTAPTISTVTPSGGTATVTWGAVALPVAGVGAVTYFVTRDGDEPAGNCPTEAAPAAVLTCKDTGLEAGAHVYQVTAMWERLRTSGATKSGNVPTGEAVKFTIAGSTSTPPTGGAVNLTITAKDAKDRVVTTYAGSHSLIFSGASNGPAGNAPTVINTSNAAIAFGSATAITFTLGVASVTSSRNGVLKIYKAGDASISATEGAVTTPAPLDLTVSPTATKFILAAATTAPTAGAEDDLTITAQDAYGNIASGYDGPHNLVFSTTASATSPNGTVPTVSDSAGEPIAFGAATAIEFGDGVASAADGDGGTLVLVKPVSTPLKATEGAIVTPTALTFTVSAGAATKLALTSSTATPTAASNFNLTTTAQDPYGNTATGYTGSKNITFSGASASPSGALPTVVNSAGGIVNFGSPTALTFTAGVAAVGSSKNGYAKLNKAGATAVSAGDGTLATATPLALTVAAAAASRLAISEPVVSAGVIGSPCLFTCAVTSLGNSGTVKARVVITDSVGNLISNVGAAKTVTVTVTTGGTIAGSPLTVPATGSAVTGTEFTYAAPVSGAFTHTITMASTGYTSATATATK